MTRTTERIALASPAPGTQRSLKVHRYGTPGARPKAYLHAALHADEWPGLLTLNHLIGRLDTADAEGGILGEIVLLPYANPMGLAQRLNGYSMGRHAFDGGGNFNRNWPDLSEAAGDALEGKLSNDAAVNVEAVRAALKDAVADLPRRTELEGLRAQLLTLSIDADMVLDIHCDSISMLHLYANRDHEDTIMILAGDIASPVVLLEETPGGGPFDECNEAPWIKLRKRFDLDQALPNSCFATTVELRGGTDVRDDLARSDAEALLRFLMRKGVVGGDPGPLAKPPCEATLLKAMDVLKAPAAGLLAWHKTIGDRVEAGDLMAELVDIEADDPASARTPIHTRTSGLFFARPAETLVQPGDQIGKVAGREVLEYAKTDSILSP